MTTELSDPKIRLKVCVGGVPATIYSEEKKRGIVVLTKVVIFPTLNEALAVIFEYREFPLKAPLFFPLIDIEFDAMVKTFVNVGLVKFQPQAKEGEGRLWRVSCPFARVKQVLA